MVHQGHITHLRLSSSKAFIIVALVSAAVYGPRAVASLPGSVMHIAPAASATDGGADEFGGAIAPTRVVPLYRERTSSPLLVRIHCPGKSRGVGCYELG